VKKYAIIGLLVLAAVLPGCKKYQSGNVGDAPVIHAIKFLQNPATEGSDLRANVEVDSNPKDGRVILSYKWYRDNELLKDYETNTLPGVEVRQGSVYYIEVKASNPLKESPWLKSDKVSVSESSFHFNKIWIEPQSPKKSDTLQVNYDCENCRGVRLYYRWLVNDKPVEGAADTELSGSDAGLKPGDQVVAEIAPEPDYPNTYHSSNPVTVVARNPYFTDNGRLWFENDTIYFQFRAQDPDGGQMTYELVQSPPGASLNAGAGMASWPVPKGFTGAVDFKVKATNSAGVAIFLSGSLQVREEQTNPQ
jgi:hypothetical protein